jgi:hypothetical protein
MCTVCGLPTPHTTFWQTVSLASLLTSGVVAILWVYLIVSRAYLNRVIRRILDRLFPS